jgi:tRNA1(Val) A37 N6-methylase TrmN6
MTLAADTTDDAVLGGRLNLRQPRKGHRVGHDAMLLAAAASASAGDHAVELGAGVGAAGLAFALRVPGVHVTLVDIDPTLVALANENATRNGLAGRVTAVVGDVTASTQAFSAIGLPPGCAQHVLMNPPFHDPASARPSPDTDRARAHMAADDTLTAWMATASHLLTGNGIVTLIWRADGLAAVLSALDGFGAIVVVPVHPSPDAAAVRILVRAVKGRRTPLQLRPGLVLNDLAGRPTAEAESILRDGRPLSLAEPKHRE